MREYRPGSLGNVNDLEGLKMWLSNELDRIADAIPGRTFQVEIKYAAPGKPRNGMIVYADGTEWDPGAGEGFYGYEGGSWVKL